MNTNKNMASGTPGVPGTLDTIGDLKDQLNPNFFNLSDKPMVLMVRHGESRSNEAIHKLPGQTVICDQMSARLDLTFDPPLSEFGLSQAEETGKHLINTVKMVEEIGGKPMKIVVWVSPFTRTKQTAEPFLRLSGLKGQEIEKTNLQEFVDPNKPYKKLPHEMITKGLKNHSSLEEYYDDLKKLNEEIKDVLNNAEPNTVLIIFGHSLTMSLLRVYQATNENYLPVDGITCLEIPNCFIAGSRYESGRWRVFESPGHFADKRHISGIHTPFGIY